MKFLIVMALMSFLGACARFQRAPDVGPHAPVDVSVVEAKPADSGLPEHWHRGAFMQIDVRAYQDSDGDGVGDLRGLIRRLDHLKDLGVRGLGLMPITPGAEFDPGYAVTDYRAINPAYGSLADFDELIREAHARGIGVILDYGVNHSAAEHPLFVQARSAASNPYRDWYLWSQPAPRGWDVLGKNPWHGDDARGHYFGTFGANMPDFNLRNPKVVAWHLDNLRFWLNRGVDGFRFDAVSHLIENDAVRWNSQPESHRLASLFAEAARAYPNRYVVCEASTHPQVYGDPAVCGAAFAFDLAPHFAKAAKGDAASAKELIDYFKRAPPSMATLVSNHDSASGPRLWEQVGGDVAAYKLAVAGYLLQPGTPFIYYGEEVGQAGVSKSQAPELNDDQRQRAPMSWTADNVDSAAGFTPKGPPFRAVAPNVAEQNVAAQNKAFGSIYSTYKELLDLRNRRPSIARGSFDQTFVRGAVIGYLRSSGDEHTLVVTNYGTRRVELEVGGLPRRARVAPIYPRRAGASYIAQIVLADARGQLQIDMPARSTRVFDVEPQRRD
jgi:alpha-amylase